MDSYALKPAPRAYQPQRLGQPLSQGPQSYQSALQLGRVTRRVAGTDALLELVETL
jgi:hypothetical protein